MKKGKYQNKGSKSVALLLALVLLLGCGIGGTIAWLMDTGDTITNTFTASNVTITLSETKPANNTAKMVPGAEIEKDPTVTVEEGSEDCYVFVKVQKAGNVDTYLTYDVATGWTEVERGTNFVVYGRTAKAGDEFSVLDGNKVTVNTTVDKAAMDAIATNGTPQLIFDAYAIQSANLQDNNGAINPAAADAADRAWEVYNGR